MLKVTIGHIRVDSEDAMEEISNIVNSVANVTEEGPDFIIVADLNPSTITKLSKDGYITEEDAIEVLEKQNYKCTLTGIELTFKPIMTASIDRIENEKGYTKENIQWVHKHINIMKHRYAQEYFINMCHMVSKHQN